MGASIGKELSTAMLHKKNHVKVVDWRVAIVVKSLTLSVVLYVVYQIFFEQTWVYQVPAEGSISELNIDMGMCAGVRARACACERV